MVESHAVMLLTRVLDGRLRRASARDGESARPGASACVRTDPDGRANAEANGFEVGRQLREEPETSRIPIIFRRAAAREAFGCRARFQLCADDYIRTPSTFTTSLLAVPTARCRARRLRKRLQRRTEELSPGFASALSLTNGSAGDLYRAVGRRGERGTGRRTTRNCTVR